MSFFQPIQISCLMHTVYQLLIIAQRCVYACTQVGNSATGKFLCIMQEVKRDLLRISKKNYLISVVLLCDITLQIVTIIIVGQLKPTNLCMMYFIWC